MVSPGPDSNYKELLDISYVGLHISRGIENFIIILILIHKIAENG